MCVELFLPLSFAALLYVLILWIALTTPPRPPQLPDLTLREEWDSAVSRIRNSVERIRRQWRRRR